MMKKKKPYLTRHDYVSDDAEEITGESMTQPGHAQTVREILFRNTQGMAYDNYKTPFYEDQATFSSRSLNEIQEMDLADKMQYLQELCEKAVVLENKIKDYQNQQDGVKEDTNVNENVDEKNGAGISFALNKSHKNELYKIIQHLKMLKNIFGVWVLDIFCTTRDSL